MPNDTTSAASVPSAGREPLNMKAHRLAKLIGHDKAASLAKAIVATVDAKTLSEVPELHDAVHGLLDAIIPIVFRRQQAASAAFDELISGPPAERSDAAQ